MERQLGHRTETAVTEELSWSSFESYDGLELAYALRPCPNGSTVLLLHGFAANSQVTWVRTGVVNAMASHGHSLVLLDARGHGRSAKPHDAGSYGQNAMVGDVRALLDHLGLKKVCVLGYSMGAVTALHLAAGEPRVIAAVAAGAGDSMRARGWFHSPASVAQAMEAPTLSYVKDPSARGYRQFADATGADRLALAAWQKAQLLEGNSGPDLSGIRVPVLIIAGSADTLAGSPIELAARIPGARGAITTGNHMNALFDSAFVGSIESFLAEVCH